MRLSVIIPANNEVGYIEPCLRSLIAQDMPDAEREIIVAANGCTDATVTVARSHADQAGKAGWTLRVLDIAEGGKVNALNQADRAATGQIRAYLDADITCDPGLFAALLNTLSTDAPRYASGRMRVAPGKSFITRAYRACWTRLPFMAEGVQGAGLFAVNPAGRARWGDFPGIISDDTYVRVMFTPEERVAVNAGYDWPLPEGWANLVKVRRRQNAGVDELHRLIPEKMGNEGKAALGVAGVIRLFLAAPVGFVVYGAIGIAVRLKGAEDWSRGR